MSKFTVRNVHVPPNPFSPLQVYSLRLFNICEETNICREGHRAIVKLINEILDDKTLGKKKKVLALFNLFLFNKKKLTI